MNLKIGIFDHCTTPSYAQIIYFFKGSMDVIVHSEPLTPIQAACSKSSLEACSKGSEAPCLSGTEAQRPPTLGVVLGNSSKGGNTSFEIAGVGNTTLGDVDKGTTNLVDTEVAHDVLLKEEVGSNKNTTQGSIQTPSGSTNVTSKGQQPSLGGVNSTLRNQQQPTKGGNSSVDSQQQGGIQL